MHKKIKKKKYHDRVIGAIHSSNSRLEHATFWAGHWSANAPVLWAAVWTHTNAPTKCISKSLFPINQPPRQGVSGESGSTAFAGKCRSHSRCTSHPLIPWLDPCLEIGTRTLPRAARLVYMNSQWSWRERCVVMPLLMPRPGTTNAYTNLACLNIMLGTELSKQVNEDFRVLIKY